MNAKPTVHATLWQRSERNYRIAEKLPLPLGAGWGWGWGEGLRPAEYLDILSFFGHSCPLPNPLPEEEGTFSAALLRERKEDLLDSTVRKVCLRAQLGNRSFAHDSARTQQHEPIANPSGVNKLMNR